MSDVTVHPKVLKRILETQRDRAEQLLSTQTKIYCRLCKATKRLKEDGHPAGLDCTHVCSSATTTMREYSTHESLGDETTLENIYEDLERVLIAINRALGLERSEHLSVKKPR